MIKIKKILDISSVVFIAGIIILCCLKGCYTCGQVVENNFANNYLKSRGLK